MKTEQYKTKLEGNNYELITENNTQYLINNDYTKYPCSYEKYLRMTNREGKSLDNVVIRMMIISEYGRNLEDHYIEYKIPFL